jgi:peptidoglycan-N-acetylglucosamine deacetylase
MHDRGGDRSQTAESLPAVIEGLLDRGYSFSRADEMVMRKHPA